MKPPYPSLTAEWHTDTYAAISPTRPELSCKGKKVVITGGGAGIGAGFAQAFADAGASSIAIIGRREPKLQETKQAVIEKEGSVKITIHIADVVDGAALKMAADEIGKWDILVANAGYLPDSGPIVDADAEEWWRGFEVNVKGPFNTAQAFLPHRNSGATIIAINAASIQVPLDFIVNFSSYNCAKFAALKYFECLANENKDLHVVNMHPGVVDTELFKKGQMKPPSMDTIDLPSHFAVWLCSQEARFLGGRFVWCNWDIEQLKARKDKIENSLLLTGNCIGWPYAPA